MLMQLLARWQFIHWCILYAVVVQCLFMFVLGFLKRFDRNLILIRSQPAEICCSRCRFSRTPSAFLAWRRRRRRCRNSRSCWAMRRSPTQHCSWWRSLDARAGGQLLKWNEFRSHWEKWWFIFICWDEFVDTCCIFECWTSVFLSQDHFELNIGKMVHTGSAVSGNSHSMSVWVCLGGSDGYYRYEGGSEPFKTRVQVDKTNYCTCLEW